MEIERMNGVVGAYNKPAEAVEANDGGIMPQTASRGMEIQVKSESRGMGQEGQESPAAHYNAQVKKAVEEFNKKAQNSEAIFGVHDGTNRITIKIIDRESKEVLKEYPPEKTLDVIAKIWEEAGLLVDEMR